MTIYADESYYSEDYLCGKQAVITAAFNYYARAATAEIKRFTGNNIDENNIPECVKNCCCELAEALCTYEKMSSHSDGKTSESVGGWSVSYESLQQTKDAYTNAVSDIVYKWLSGTGLLFTGVR